MNDRQQASQILQGLAPHVARRALYRLGWVKMLHGAERRRRHDRRQDVAADLIGAARGKGQEAPGPDTLWKWETKFQKEGFGGLVDRPRGPRGRPRDAESLPTPAEVDRLDLPGIAELLTAIAARLRKLGVVARPQTDGDG